MKIVICLILILYTSLVCNGQSICNPDSMTQKELLSVNCCITKTKINSKKKLIIFPNIWDYKNDEFAMGCLTKFLTEKNSKWKIVDANGKLNQVIIAKDSIKIKWICYYKNGKKKSVFNKSGMKKKLG